MRIMVVEDDALIALDIVSLLEDMGHEVVAEAADAVLPHCRRKARMHCHTSPNPSRAMTICIMAPSPVSPAPHPGAFWAALCRLAPG